MDSDTMCQPAPIRPSSEHTHGVTKIGRLEEDVVELKKQLDQLTLRNGFLEDMVARSPAVAVCRDLVALFNRPGWSGGRTPPATWWKQAYYIHDRAKELLDGISS